MGRRRLRGGFSVWLPDHRSTDGVLFRRYLRAAQEIVGPANGSERVRVVMRQYAIAGVVFEQHARHWAELVHKRETGRGKRPNVKVVRLAAKRLGLADITLKEATARLETLAAQIKKAPTLAEYLAQSGDGGTS